MAITNDRRQKSAKNDVSPSQEADAAHQKPIPTRVGEPHPTQQPRHQTTLIINFGTIKGDPALAALIRSALQRTLELFNAHDMYPTLAALATCLLYLRSQHSVLFF